MSGRTRIFYRSSPEEVVLEKDGQEIVTYKSTQQLIETHIKGLLARDQQDLKKVREILKRYRPSDSVKG
jgi:hypothetical protein